MHEPSWIHRFSSYGYGVEPNDGVVDLRQVLLRTDGQPEQLVDHSMRDPASGVRAIFRDLERELIAYIAPAHVVLGAVAWLTHERILAALSSVSHGVALVVQKEDFLRPDHDVLRTWGPTWRDKLHTRYAQLPEGPTRYAYPYPLGSCTVCGDPTVDPVRCVGNYNTDQVAAFPRMHNKFLLFCHVRDEDEGESPEDVVPYAVWTGSFNFTKNAAMSFENALYITIPKVVEAYYHEWAQIMALSEPLNWEAVWVAPEWRIGT